MHKKIPDSYSKREGGNPGNTIKKKKKKVRISTLHEKAVMIIDCNTHKNSNIMYLEMCYRLQPPRRRRAEHHSAIMYRLGKNGQLLDTYRPKVNVHSRRKIKLKHRRRNVEKFLKSPLSHGIKLWNNSTICY